MHLITRFSGTASFRAGRWAPTLVVVGAAIAMAAQPQPVQGQALSRVQAGKSLAASPTPTPKATTKPAEGGYIGYGLPAVEGPSSRFAAGTALSQTPRPSLPAATAAPATAAPLAPTPVTAAPATAAPLAPASATAAATTAAPAETAEVLPWLLPTPTPAPPLAPIVVAIAVPTPEPAAPEPPIPAPQPGATPLDLGSGIVVAPLPVDLADLAGGLSGQGNDGGGNTGGASSLVVVPGTPATPSPGADPTEVAQAVPQPTPTPNYFNVKDFGAKGDGVTDDYAALQAVAVAVNRARTGTVFFPPGTYRIDRYRVTRGVRMNDVKSIAWTDINGLRITGYGAKIDLKGDFKRIVDYVHKGRSYSYTTPVAPFEFTNCANFTLEGLEIDGNVDQMTRDEGVTEAPGHAIRTSKCTDYLIKDVLVHHIPSDGIYLGSSSVADRNAQIVNSVSRNNGRQGLTIIQLRGGRFQRCTFANTGLTGAGENSFGPYGGHAPQAGVDVEPNYNANTTPAADVATGDLLFEDCRFSGNQGSQFVAAGGTDTENVVVRSSILERNPTSNSYDVILAINGGTIDGCTLRVNKIYPTWLSGFSNTRIANSRIESASNGIITTANQPLVVENCDLVGTHAEAFSSYFPYIKNAAATFSGNRVQIPAAAYKGGSYHIISLLQGMAVSRGNTFTTDLADPARFFATDYKTTKVEGDWYKSGTAMRPAYNSTWNSAAPFSR